MINLVLLVEKEGRRKVKQPVAQAMPLLSGQQMDLARTGT